MAENKSCQIVVNLEPSIYAMAVQQAEAEGKAMSAYGRGLVIWDLINKGRLDKVKLGSLITGDSQAEMLKILGMVRDDDAAKASNENGNNVASLSLVSES